MIGAALGVSTQAAAGSAQFSCDAAADSHCHYVLFAPDGAIKKFALPGGQSGWARDVIPGYRFCFGLGEEPDPATCEWRKLRAIEPDANEVASGTAASSQTVAEKSAGTSVGHNASGKNMPRAAPEAFQSQIGRKRTPGVTVETITLENVGTGFRKRTGD
jgi:hypothetical protein